MRLKIVICAILLSFSLFAQNEQLAKDFFEKGDFEKALVSYEKLYKTQKRLNYFLKIIECHQQLEQYNIAEGLLKNELNNRVVQPQLYIELGYNYALKKEQDRAEKYYNQAIALLQNNPNYAYTLGRTFEKYSLLDQAILTYKTATNLNDQLNFNFNLARIYGEQGKIDEMFSNYLDLMATNTSYINGARRNISQYLTEDPLNSNNLKYKKVLLKKLQEAPNTLWNEQLS